MASLHKSLILNRYILSLFGVTDLAALSANLKETHLEGYDENGVSHLHHALVARFYSNEALPKSLLFEYDQNIYSHTRFIGSKREEDFQWKYFQYLALLFTEIYLDKYFSNAQGLLEELNGYLLRLQAAEPNNFKEIEKFEKKDLNKLAFWNATGSGKTLLMHVNILQYKHYIKKHNRSRELNRVIVLTPNEGLSRQHLKELRDSGFDAELFDKNAGGLYVGSKIEIIDIHKLEEKSGQKTIAIEAFESNNLVLVDEGHRGSGGEVWKEKRNRICAEGFSYEYSATFGQAVSGQSDRKKTKALLNEYGKATIFNYSYPYFHKDGFGKNFQLLNLQGERWKEYQNQYLIASLLAFYEQTLLYLENQKTIEPFLIEKPLAIFVGKNVTAQQKSAFDTQASDIIQIVQFFSKFIKNEGQETVLGIERILQNQDGLLDDKGRNIFRNSFQALRATKKSASQIFADVLKVVFNSEVQGALLHLDNLKGQDGEIGLRVGSTENYFGVINVGDDKKLLELCEKEEILTDNKAFSSSLFHGINLKGSKINVLIGSKKFSEGWSSWRVSTMGLMNIGQGEGSEIIQLFGRGVRLKGYKMSLKRSSELDLSMRPTTIPGFLPILETLNIFGIRADYMEQFKEEIEKEVGPTDDDFEQVNITMLPTIENLSEKKLKYIKIKDGVDFKKDQTVSEIANQNSIQVLLDWYPKVKVLKSSRGNETEILDIEEGKLRHEHLAFLDWDQVYFEIEKFKNERSWHNLTFTKEELQQIFQKDDWYRLRIPAPWLQCTDFAQTFVWREIAVSLAKGYVEKVYNRMKARYESQKLIVDYMDQNHPNFQEEYQILVKKSETTLISKLRELKDIIGHREYKNFQIGRDFESLFSSQHLYYPLLYMNGRTYDEVVKIKPLGLNKGERDFVEDLKAFHAMEPEIIKDKELYLLRNMSRKGIGFFESNGFYPDFILWIVAGEKQYVSFIDPKGLRQVSGFSSDKIQLYKKIRTEIQPKLGDVNLELNSFIISNTPFGQLDFWKDQEGIEDFNNQYVFFQGEQKNEYIKLMLDKVLN